MIVLLDAFNNFIITLNKKMQEANMHSEVKIHNPRTFAAEASLDGSSDGEDALEYQKSRSNVKLEPIRVTLTDNARGKNQAPGPYQALNPKAQSNPPYVQPPQNPQNPQYQQPSSNQQTQPNRYSQNPQGGATASPGVSKEMNSTMRESGTSSPLRKKGVSKGYEMANYQKAVQYQNTQSYRIKTTGTDGHEDYEPMSIWGSNQQLKQFGLGVYLLFQFLKRLIVSLLLMSAVQIFALVATYNGTGMSTYTNSSSFTMYLSKFTVGNIQNGDRQTYLVITICDIVSMLILMIFWIHWRSFQSSILDQMEKDHKIVNPVNYVVAVENFSDEMTNIMTLQQELKNYIDNIYKGAYQVQVVYNYLGRFDRFIQYDQQIEIVETENQIIKQTKKKPEKLVEEEKKLYQIEEELQKVSQAFEPLYAFIHFRTLKAKMAFLNHCKRFKLQNTFGQAFQRAICCTSEPPQRLLFLGKFPVMLRNAKLSRPEQINWRNIDISGLSRFVRWFFSIFFVVVSILITSSLIGFCTLYVASTSSCQNYVAPTGTITAQISAIKTDANKFCFCNANIASLYTDADINSFCSSISNKVLVTNILQISASVISSVTNVILGIIIAVIAKYLLRPNSIPKEYLFIFWGSLISNFINTCIIPLLLNGSIFGVQFISYLKFIDFMDFKNLSIFKDFTRDWYALISPYYMTFLIIGCFVSPLIGLVVFSFKSCIKNWRVKSKCEDNDNENPLVQKQANKKIASLQFDYAEQSANIILLLFIGILYSGLMPLTIPILTVGMFWIFICKKTILLKYSIKIPADQTLNQTIINFLPFVILAHGLFSIWSHTATPSTVTGDTIFLNSAPIFTVSLKVFNSDIDRIFNDILMLGEPVLVAALIILDYTIINFFSGLANCCKDEYQMPIQWASIENQQFSDRIQKVNILGSYKLANNPTYGHAIKAFKELAFRNKKQGFDETKDNLNPEFSM